MGISHKLCISKYEEIDCGNNKKRWRLKNPENFLREYLNQYQIEAGGTLSELGGGFNFRFGRESQEFRREIDHLNQQILFYLRSLYEMYASDPCNDRNFERFQNALENVMQIGFQMRLIQDISRTGKSLPEAYDRWKYLIDKDMEGKPRKQLDDVLKHKKDEYEKSIPKEIQERINEIQKLMDKLE